MDEQEKLLLRRDHSSDSNRSDLFDIGSTLSGNSRSTLRGKPYKNTSVFKQTQYLDQIEDVIKRRKRERKHKAIAFLRELELKKSEAVA